MGDREAIESLQRAIAELVDERQRLRAAREAAEELERNRVALARAQHELSRALIRIYLPDPGHAT